MTQPEIRPSSTLPGAAPASRPRLALFGGTFDPVHLGHLCMAEWVFQTLALDRVLFVPAAVPPHKQHLITPAAQRVAMLERAIAGNPALGISEIELQREGPSYTLHTLQQVRAANPEAALWWVIGLDSLLSLHQWYGYEQFPHYARFAVVPRPRQRFDERAEIEAYVQAQLPAFAPILDWIDMPRLEIASSSIRAWLAQGLSCRYLLPEPVRAYIASEGLYSFPKA